MLWSNPRTVFFREEALVRIRCPLRPARRAGRAAHARPLDRGRPAKHSLRHTGVARHRKGRTLNVQKLVMAQDTGGAIVGAVRADLFTGWGGWSDEAYLTAAALKQPLQMWVLVPR